MTNPATSPKDETIAVIEEFIRRRFRVPADDTQFGVDVNLWEAGYVDSAGAVETIAFLEEKFGITLPEGVLFDPNFAQISGMARIIDETRPTVSGPEHPKPLAAAS